MAEKKPKLKTNLTNKEQSERFKHTARELGVDQNLDFEDIFKKIAPLKHSRPGGKKDDS